MKKTKEGRKKEEEEPGKEANEEARRWGVPRGGLNPRQFDNKPHLVMTLSDCVFTQSACTVCVCACLYVQPTYVLSLSLLPPSLLLSTSPATFSSSSLSSPPFPPLPACQMSGAVASE